MKGIPATLVVLGVYIDGGVLDQGFGEGNGVLGCRRSGAQKEGKANMVATVDIDSRECAVGLFARLARRTGRCTETASTAGLAWGYVAAPASRLGAVGSEGEEASKFFDIVFPIVFPKEMRLRH